MIDIAVIGGALKTATDALKSVKDLAVGTAIKAKIAQAYEEILSARETAMAAQAERSSLLKRISELEEELVRLKTWGSEKEKYKLTEIDSCAFAYTPEEGSELAETPHWLCANCFHEGQKSILQVQEGIRGVGSANHACPRCKAKLATRHGVSPHNPVRF